MILFRIAKRRLLFYYIACFFSFFPVHAEEVVLDVGFMPILSQLPIVVAYEKDRLNIENTHLSIYPYNSYTSLEAAMRVGSIDIASLPAAIVLSMAVDGYDVLILGACSRGGARVMAKSAGDLSMLKGGIIGVPGLDSNENLKLKRAMNEIGLRFGRDYHPIEAPFSAVLSNMKAGKLDGFFLPEPIGLLAEKEKIAYPSNGPKGLTAGLHNSFLVIRKKTLEAKRRSVTLWIQRVVAASQYIEADIRASGGVQIAIIQEPWLHLQRDLVSEALAKRTGDLIFGGFNVDESEIKDYLHLAGELNLLKKSVIIKDIIYKDLMEHASQ